MLLRKIANEHDQLAEYEFTSVAFEDRAAFGASLPTPFAEEAALVERLRNRDDAAFEQMVRKFSGRLLATARRYLRSEDDAHDALQDALLCAFKSISIFKSNSQLSTWLHRIVINSSLMRLRARRRRPEADEAPTETLLPPFDATGHWTAQSQNSLPAYIYLEIAETQALVRRCINELPEQYRLVLMLRDIDELETCETAALLGLTTNNVKVRLHRARQALKTLIERTDLATSV